MAMKEGIFLHNTHHVQTDSFGAYSEQSPIVRGICKLRK